MAEPMTLEGVAADLRRLGYHGYAAAIDAAISERDALTAKVEQLRTIANVNGDWSMKYSDVCTERDALRARIESAPVIEWPRDVPSTTAGWITKIEAVQSIKAMRGKRVRLIVESGAAGRKA